MSIIPPTYYEYVFIIIFFFKCYLLVWWKISRFSISSCRIEKKGLHIKVCYNSLLCWCTISINIINQHTVILTKSFDSEVSPVNRCGISCICFSSLSLRYLVKGRNRSYIYEDDILVIRSRFCNKSLIKRQPISLSMTLIE